MRSLPDYPDRPSADEAIRTAFATGVVSVGFGLLLSGRVALGMLFGGDITDSLFQSAGVIFLTGFGVLAMASAFLAYHAHRRYQFVPRDPAVDDGGEQA